MSGDVGVYWGGRECRYLGSEGYRWHNGALGAPSRCWRAVRGHQKM